MLLCTTTDQTRALGNLCIVRTIQGYYHVTREVQLQNLIPKLQQGLQHSHLSLFTGNGNATIFVVLDRRATLLDKSTIASSSEEGWNPSSPCPDSLCKSTLWGEKVTDYERRTREIQIHVHSMFVKNCISLVTWLFFFFFKPTWGVSSTSSSPDRYCRSNSAFSPTYEEIILLICLVWSSRPRPKLSTLRKTHTALTY